MVRVEKSPGRPLLTLTSVALLEALRDVTLVGGAGTFRDGLVHQGQHLAREADREAPYLGIGRTDDLTRSRGPLRVHALLEEKRQQPDERLDAESKISGSPLSSGRRSEIVAITPPREFSQAVWDELVRQGKLKKANRGTYELKTDE